MNPEGPAQEPAAVEPQLGPLPPLRSVQGGGESPAESPAEHAQVVRAAQLLGVNPIQLREWMRRRNPPHDDAAEESVIGGILFDFRILPAVAQILLPEQIYHLPRRRIYETMLVLLKENRPADLITVAAEMRKAGSFTALAAHNGEAYLAHLANQVGGTVELVPTHARIVADLADARRKIEVGEDLLRETVKGGDTAPLLRELEALGSGRRDELRSILISQVKPEKVQWLWSGRIPEAKITVIDGDPGLGKSTLVLDIAARLSRGAPMPGEGRGVQGHVIVWSMEDGLADTIRPRLEMAGADLDGVTAITEILSLPQDLPRIRNMIERTRARLFILDPLMAAFSSDVNTYRDQDVRRTLAQMQELAQTTGCAMLIVRHLTKGEGPAIYRGGGSIGIIGAARSALLVAKDPRCPEERRVLARSKCNLGPPVPSLCYSLLDRGDVSTVYWEGECAFTADELVAPLRKGAAAPEDDQNDGPSLSLEQKIVRCLHVHKTGLIAEAIAKFVKHSINLVKPILRAMEERGEIRMRPGVRNAKIYVHLDHWAQVEMDQN